MRPSNKSLSADKSKVLLVEGANAFHFVLGLLNSNSITSIHLVDFGGIADLRPAIEIVMRDPLWSKYVALAVVRDAELNRTNSWVSVTNSITNALAVTLTAEGSFVKKDTLNVGAFLLPPGAGIGAIEDMCLQCPASSTDFKDCSDLVANKIKNGAPSTSPGWRSKAVVHSMIALSRAPDATLGNSVAVGVWDLNAKPIADLTSFLKALDQLQ